MAYSRIRFEIQNSATMTLVQSFEEWRCRWQDPEIPASMPIEPRH